MALLYRRPGEVESNTAIGVDLIGIGHEMYEQFTVVVLICCQNMRHIGKRQLGHIDLDPCRAGVFWLIPTAVCSYGLRYYYQVAVALLCNL